MRPQKKRILFACFVFWLGAWPADSSAVRINPRDDSLLARWAGGQFRLTT